MLKVKYLGLFPVTLPDEISVGRGQTLAQVMESLIKACKMADDFFWEHHLVILNGRQPEMEEVVHEGDLLHILSYSEGG